MFSISFFFRVIVFFLIIATYNDSGQLTCVLCKSVVKSEAVWVVHTNSKQHREHVELAKKLKEKTNNFTTPLKRPLTPPLEVPEKKLKGILKNSASSEASTPTGEVPDDFFDNRKGTTNNAPPILPIKKAPEKMEIEEPTDAIPEGFFDDPKLDAKVL